MPMRSRTYSSEQDYKQMLRLVTEIYALSGPTVHATPGDLDWWRFPPDDQGGLTDTQLWFDDSDRLVGFAWPSGSQVDLNVHPDYLSLHADMLDWAEQHRRRTGEAEDDGVTLTAWAYEHEKTREAVLAARGFERSGASYNHRARRLDGTLEAPSLPDGYTLDHMHDDLIESRAAAQRDAFQSTKMSAERYRRLKHAPTYRPELDLVVRDPEGEVAAFAIVWFDEANRVGTFEPVGTRSAHKRLGLARALLSDGMNRLREAGADTALVLSEGKSEAANHLYESAGLQVVGRDCAWTKRLS